MQISLKEAFVSLCTREGPEAVGEALLDEALLELLQEELNIALELGGVLDAAGSKVAIDALLIKLLEGELCHQTLGKRDLVGRVFPINFFETIGPHFFCVDLVFVLLVKDEVKNLLGF